MMKSTRSLALVLAFAAASWGCGGASDPADAAAKPPAATSTDEALVDPALIEACAGMSVDKAAGMLGVPAAELEVREQFSERLNSQTCRYWSPKS